MKKNVLKELAESVGGKIDWVAKLPDGSGCATMSFPLPKTHWIYDDKLNVPPMPFRMGSKSIVLNKTRKMWSDCIKKAGRYAVKSATMNGKEMDFDPDALLQNLVVGMIGYWTDDGLWSYSWANPKEIKEATK